MGQGQSGGAGFPGQNPDDVKKGQVGGVGIEGRGWEGQGAAAGRRARAHRPRRAGCPARGSHAPRRPDGDPPPRPRGARRRAAPPRRPHSPLPQEKKKKWEPPAPPPRIGRKQRRRDGGGAAGRLPTITPSAKCRLRLLKLDRVKDWLLMEREFVAGAEAAKPGEERTQEERSRVDDLRGSPLSVGTLEEIVDETHAIVSSSVGPEYYVSILSFVDRRSGGGGGGLFFF